MNDSSKLFAWTEECGDGTVLAAFVSARTYDRPPATRVCNSAVEARQWVEQEAACLTLPVTWVEQKPFR